jgi:hypothetical protein
MKMPSLKDVTPAASPTAPNFGSTVSGGQIPAPTSKPTFGV